MKGKKKFASAVLHYSGVSLLGRNIGSPKLTIFNFHRIHKDLPASERDGNFDIETFGPSVGEFKSHVEWIKKNSNVISEEVLLDSIRNHSPLPKKSTMITFDDGYIDNYTLAFPVLRELNLPATFFITTESINERKLGWWDIISYLIKKTPLHQINLRGYVIPIKPDRAMARHLLMERMKLGNESENTHLLADLAEACHVELPTKEMCSAELMTWENIKDASENGISIGAHTHTHRVLSTLDLDTQEQELIISKTEIEKHIGKTVKTLAYPVGGHEHFDIETMAMAKKLGFEAAFSFSHQINNLSQEMDPFNIRRVVCPEDIPQYASMLAFPKIFVDRRCVATQPSYNRYARQNKFN